jgi:hypothetical protein
MRARPPTQGAASSSTVATSPLWDEEIGDAARGVAAVEAGLLDPSYLTSLVHVSPDFPHTAVPFCLTLPHLVEALRAREAVRQRAALAGLASPKRSPGEHEGAVNALTEEFLVSAELVRLLLCVVCVGGGRGVLLGRGGAGGRTGGHHGALQKSVEQGLSPGIGRGRIGGLGRVGRPCYPRGALSPGMSVQGCSDALRRARGRWGRVCLSRQCVCFV